MKVVLSASALAVGRGDRAVLSDVDLDVVAGERLALVGANGSGKTTLLRALGALDPPRSGQLLWAGQAPPRGPSRVRHLGLLFQNEPPSPFTVREMVTLGLGLEHPPDRAARVQVDAICARFDLAMLADRPCAALSGGEAQRVALARALVACPRVLLLDEPTNHLDPAHRAALRATLDDLRGEVAVVLATHDLEAAAAADRVALLAGGRMTALGPADTVMTASALSRLFGVPVRRLDDPRGGPPFLRVEAAA